MDTTVFIWALIALTALNYMGMAYALAKWHQANRRTLDVLDTWRASDKKLRSQLSLTEPTPRLRVGERVVDEVGKRAEVIMPTENGAFVRYKDDPHLTPWKRRANLSPDFYEVKAHG